VFQHTPAGYAEANTLFSRVGFLAYYSTLIEYSLIPLGRQLLAKGTKNIANFWYLSLPAHLP
jgi:hypothetical protein